MKRILLTVLILFSAVLTIAAQSVPQLGKAPVKKIIAAMTLEEKAALVVGARYRNPNSQNANNNQLPVSSVPLTQGAAGFTYAIPRLGIPPIVLADGPAGLRISPTRQNDDNTYYCTAFPVATLLASTWDTELANSVGKAMGNEVLEYGADVILGPALNIHRNPLCGRNFEYFSEDPLITGKIAASLVSGIQSNGVGTSIKHFACNNAETNRNSSNTIVSERALREIYLKGFGIAVKEGKPWTVMSSYNLINGTYTSESNDLLTKVLRNDWNFGGFVMTDWGGGKDAVAQMQAGNDLIEPGNANQSKTIVDAVNSGKLDVKILDTNVERILNIVLQSPKFKGYKYSNKPDLKAHALVTRQAADEGMVLLKNEAASLPLPESTKKIAAFGNTSYEIITGGTGSGDVNEAYSVALVEGLNNAGFTVNENLQNLYNSYLKSVKEGRPRSRGFMGASGPIAEFGVTIDLAGSMANVADAALITIGRNSGEGADRKPDEGDFQLASSEKELIKLVCDAFHAKNKKVIVVLNIGGVVETASWRNMPDAILLAWQAGQETGNSIADILCGKVNPSGKLASSFPVNYADVPSASNFPGKIIAPVQATDNQNAGPRRQPMEVTYEEGIYVGYRYYTTFRVPVSYEFGYGLSYTTFEYSNLKISSPKFVKTLTVTVDIRNTGKMAGKEVAELYLSAPAGKLDKPERELKGFAKTRLLQPGESQTISFTLDGSSLASFDTSTSSWTAEAGKYTVNVGASSKDTRATGTFSAGSTIVVKKESKALAPAVAINELKPK
jgi:beta-glucosidase